MHELLSAMADAGQSPGTYGEYLVLVWKSSLGSRISEGQALVTRSHPVHHTEAVVSCAGKKPPNPRRH